MIPDVPLFVPCGDRCPCESCDIDLRQGRSLASHEASARAFVYATLGIVALGVGAALFVKPAPVKQPPQRVYTRAEAEALMSLAPRIVDSFSRMMPELIPTPARDNPRDAK